jgi:hypothetical protein
MMAEMPIASSVQRIVTFHKDLRGRDMAEIYLDNPASRQPFFSARVAKSDIIRFLERLRARFEDRGDYLFFESGEDDEMLRKLVIFMGVRQSYKVIGEYQMLRLMDMVRNLTLVESLFWFSRFMDAYGWSPWMRVLRVAKAFKVLYGF